MQLNGAQVVALYGLCTELGFGQNVKFEIKRANALGGDVFVDVTGDLLIGAGHYRLKGEGGREFLGGATKPVLADPPDLEGS